jgi:hypothetical protein
MLEVSDVAEAASAREQGMQQCFAGEPNIATTDGGRSRAGAFAVN